MPKPEAELRQSQPCDVRDRTNPVPVLVIDAYAERGGNQGQISIWKDRIKTGMQTNPRQALRTIGAVVAL